MSSVTLPGAVAGLALCIVLAAFLLCAACTSTGPSTAAPPGFESDLEKITSQPQYAHAIWGIIVTDPATGKTLYAKNADQMFVPASSTKLFSSAAVLEALGPDYRFTTPVYAAGAVDKSGALDGNLVLVATGDPEMGGRTLSDGTVEFMDSDHSESHALLTVTDPVAGLDDLARQVKASGISTARDVVIDDRLFAPFAMENVGMVSPIVVNDNMVDVSVTAGSPGSAPVVTMRPQSPLYRIENRATTGQAGSASSLEVGESEVGTIIVAGAIPAGAGTLNQSVHVTDPAAFARSLFIGSLRKQGVNVTAPATGDNPAAKLPAAGSYAGTKKVASLISPTLAEDVKLTLKVSQNYHANHYVMLLALADNKTSFYDGMDKEGRVLQSIGLDTTQVMLSDGAGGDRVNHVTPEAAAQLLTLVQKRPYAKEFIKAQPILGVDGSTVHHCRAGNPACGKVYAKTGTFSIPDFLNGGRSILTSKALAGYVDTKSGSRQVFAIYVNNVPLSGTVTQDSVGTDIGSIAGLVYQYY
jgi:serine-type D-Ala-D-Ala carboxypeptidase/endopeptidase (penicillin-binding protein 4)